MRAARKCSPTRGTHSTRWSSGRSRRPLRNPRQNTLKLQIPFVASVVAKRVFVEVGLQVLRAHIVVHAADSPLHQAPESFNRLSVDVARDVDFRAAPDTAMDIAMHLQPVIRNVVVGEYSARRQNIFLRQTVKSFLGRIGRDASDDAAIVSRSAALDHANNGYFMAPERWPSLSALPTPLSAVVHLIHLNRRTLQLHSIFGEQGANLF